jgi:sterol desaturase/sphingolipid hydroxylase (fatty acid hydroxylase superfamily)
MSTHNPTTAAAGGPDKNYNSVSAFFVAVAVMAVLCVGWWFIVKTLAPHSLHLEFAGKEIVFADFQKKLLGGLVLGLVTAVAVFLAEYLLAGWRESSIRHLMFGAKSAWSDVVMFLLDQVRLTKVILVVFTLGIGLASGEWLHRFVVQHTGVEFGVGAWPVWIQLPVVYLIYTYLDFWTHRVGHMKTFWPIHRFHHAAKDFYILTAVRVHPADLSSLFILAVPLMFIAPSAETLFLLFAVQSFVRLSIHSRIQSNWGWIGRWLVQSPLDHRMHHIRDMSNGQGENYSLMPLWDRLHNTWRPGGYPELEIGVDDKDDRSYRHGAWVMPDVVRDYVDFLRNVGAKFGLCETFYPPEIPTRTKPSAAAPNASEPAALQKAS